MKPGENLLIARTANGFMVTGVDDGDGKTSVAEAYVFTVLGESRYNSDKPLLSFIAEHFKTPAANEDEE